MLRLKGMVIGGAVLAAVAGGAWLYVELLQSRLATASAQLETARAAVDEAVSANRQTLETVRLQQEQFAHTMEALGAFDAEVRAHRTDLDALRREIADAAETHACMESEPVRAVLDELRRRARPAGGDGGPDG